MRKILNIFRHSFSVVISNKPRYMLTAIGVIFAMVAFIAGNIIICSISSDEMASYVDFDSDTLIVNNVDDNEFNLIKQNVDGFYNEYCLFGSSHTVKTEKIENGYNVNFNIYGVTEKFHLAPIPAIDNMENAVKTKIIQGRCFNYGDMLSESNSVIINQAFGEMLFGSEELIGQKIVIGSESYTIVGVLSNSLDVEQLLKEIEKNRNERINVTIPIYVPITNISAKTRTLVISNLSNTELSAQKVEKILGSLEKVSTFERLVVKNQKEINKSRNLLDIVMIIFMCILAVVIALLMAFSSKERIGEIGIKKALGASNSDITLQFVFESLNMSIFTSIIGIILGLAFSIIILTFISVYSFVIEWNVLALAILINFTICILSVVFPSVIASKRNIVEALRFE